MTDFQRRTCGNFFLQVNVAGGAACYSVRHTLPRLSCSLASLPKATLSDCFPSIPTRSGDAEDLAQKLAQLWISCCPGPELEREAIAWKGYQQRLRRFAETFLEVAAEVAA